MGSRRRDELVAALGGALTRDETDRVHASLAGPPGPAPVSGRQGLPSPVALEALVVAALDAAGVARAKVYAYQHTGRLVTVDNAAEVGTGAIRHWHEAISRHRRAHR